MKSLGIRLILQLSLLLPLSAALGQGSLFELNFPSNKHLFPTNKSSDRVNPGIATGSSGGLYMRFGEDIAKLCANYGIDLNTSDPNRYRYPKFRVNVYATQGGFDSVKRLRYEREVQLAIVQSDLRYFANERAKVELNADKQRAWRQIGEEIKLVLPLYQEKVHILVRPADKPRFKDLAGLMKAGATVNVGQISSGGMITCKMIEDLIKGSREWKNNQNGTWVKTYHSATAALKMMTGQDMNSTDHIDAVILVGGTPYPTLTEYGIKSFTERGFLKNTVKYEPDLALLDVGDEAMDLLANSPFGGYHPTMIDPNAYEFMGNPNGTAEPINTVGVYSCLVTHASYGTKSKDPHKIEWVRHILFRILTKLDGNPSGTGLPRDFGSPRAGNKWREVRPVGSLDQEADWQDLYGWERHDDPIIREMVDLWSKDKGINSGSDEGIIDPIKLF